MHKKEIPKFVKQELDFFVDQCNFTPREKEFLYLSNEENSLERIAEKMNYSVSTVSRICKTVKQKILKVL